MDELCCDCTGDGPDVLLVHGWASSRLMWQSTVDALAGSTRLWSVDLPGFGDTPLVEGKNPNIEHHTEALAEFCVRKGIRPHTIIAHSMGGLVTLKLMLLQPDLAERLVLVCPVITGRFGSFGVGKILARGIGENIIARSKLIWRFAQWRMIGPIETLQWTFRRDVARRVQRDIQRTQWQAAMYGLSSMAYEDLSPQLHRIQQPTLVMVGKFDLTVPPGEGRLAARLMPNARLVEFPRVRHNPFDEAPERFIETVRTFLHDADANYATIPST